MLGIFLIYFIWKAYAELATGQNKSKWFGLLGIAAFYTGSIGTGFVIGLLAELEYLPPLDEISDVVLNLVGLPVGLLTCWLVYRYLKNRWSRTVTSAHAEALDADI